MQRTKRFPALAVALAGILVLLATAVSCEERLPPTAETVLEAMLEAAPGHPAGQSFSRTADPDSAAYLRSVLFAALYGDTGRNWLERETSDGGTAGSPAGEGDSVKTGNSAMICDGAIFLSTAAHPFELGVFRCADLDGALSVAALCQTRINALSAVWQDSAYGILTARATVTVEGCYVLMAVADDPQAVLAEGRRAVKGSAWGKERNP